MEKEKTIQKAIGAVYRGSLVECTKEEYAFLRTALQEQSGKWIDSGDHLRAQIALNEVKRLDRLHGEP